MRTVLHACWPLVAAVTIGLLTFDQSATAQTKGAAGDAKSIDKAIYDSLGDIINHGADLFNNYGDYAGCYRVYEAGLIAIRPLLAHRPELQKAIDAGRASAEEKHRVTARAFALRKVLGDVRKQVSSGSGVANAIPAKKGSMGMTGGKKIESNKNIVEPARPKREKVAETKASEPAANMAQVSGKVTYKAKPVAGGWYVTLVSATDKYTFSTYLRGDGSYTFDTPVPAGTYAVAIEEGPQDKANPPAGQVAIPQRYQNTVTSGLTVRIRPGKSNYDVNLQ